MVPLGQQSRVSRLSKRYGAIEAVRGINLEVGDGEIFGLIGPDGAGKTSTFQILAGVMEATAAERRKCLACLPVRLGRRPVTSRKRSASIRISL